MFEELPSMVWMRPSGSDGLDHADVAAVPDDEVARVRLLGRLASRGRCAAPSPRSPRPRRSPGPARRAARRPAWPPRTRSSCTTGRRRCPPWRCGTRRCAGSRWSPAAARSARSPPGRSRPSARRRRCRSPRPARPPSSAPAAVAWPSTPAKLAADAVGDVAVAAVEEVVVAAGAATLGWSIAWISAMRARATSRLTSRVVGRGRARSGTAEGRPRRAAPFTADAASAC